HARANGAADHRDDDAAAAAAGARHRARGAYPALGLPGPAPRGGRRGQADGPGGAVSPGGPSIFLGRLTLLRGVLQAHDVAQAAQDVLLEALVLPQLVAVAQGGVEDAALAVLLRPGQGVVLVGALARLSDRGRVQAHQHVQVLAVVGALELVDLVGDLERLAEVLGGRVLGGLDDPLDLLVPGVAVEVAADQFAVLGPLVERVGGAVAAGEALARLDEGEQVGLLRVGEWQL